MSDANRINEQESTQFPTHPEALIAREIEWERGAVERGVRRYREALTRERRDGGLEARALADLEPGQEIIRKVVGPVSKLIEATARQAKEVYKASGKGRQERWLWPILSLDADEQAFIAVRAMLVTQINRLSPLRSVALEIGRNMQLQRDYELWKDDQNRRDREARKAGTWVPNHWKYMMRAGADDMSRAFLKWSAKSPKYDRVEWSREDRLHIGIKLVSLVVEAAPGWFEVGMSTIGNGRYRTEKVVMLTEEARAWVTSRHAFNELRRPWYVPMLAPPLDWVRETEEHDEDGGMAVQTDDASA